MWVDITSKTLNKALSVFDKWGNHIDNVIYTILFLVPIFACFIANGDYIKTIEVFAAMLGVSKSSYMIFDKITINNMAVTLLMLFIMVKISMYSIRMYVVYDIVIKGSNRIHNVDKKIFGANRSLWLSLSFLVMSLSINTYIGLYPLVLVSFIIVSKNIKRVFNYHRESIEFLKENKITESELREIENYSGLDGMMSEITKYKERIDKNSKEMGENIQKIITNG